MRASSVVASALLAVLLGFGGLWLLNNTIIGLNVKCHVLNDLGACFILALSEPAIPSQEGDDRGSEYVPRPTETPEERAAREAAELQARLDADVQAASDALSDAVDSLERIAEDLDRSTSDMAAAVEDLGSSVDDMEVVYSDLHAEIGIRPMDDVQQGSVCVALGGVEVSRGGVDVAFGGWEIAESPYRSAKADMSGYVAAVQSALADLKAAVTANPNGAAAPFSLDDGESAVLSLTARADLTAAAADRAAAKVAKLLKAADSWLSKARKLAATVATC